MSKPDKPLAKFLTFATSAIICTGFLYSLGADTFIYRDFWRTFFYSWSAIKETLFNIGGFSSLAGDFLLQTGGTGALAAMALMSALALWLLCRVLIEYCGSTTLAHLIRALPATIAIAHQDPLLDAGTVVSMILAFAAFLGRRKKESTSWLYIYTIAAALLLFILGGCAASIFVIFCLIDDCRNSKNLLSSLAAAVAVAFAAFLAEKLGIVPSVFRSLTPAGFFFHLAKVPAIVWYPWGVAVAIFAAASIFKPVLKGKLSHAIVGILALGAVAGCMMPLKNKFLDEFSQAGKSLAIKVVYGDWNGVLRLCDQHPELYEGNLIFMNCANMAYAHKGKLVEKVLQAGAYDYKVFLMPKSKSSPYVNGLLSQLHYRMGSIFTAMQYSFESLEGLDNRSPLMLVTQGSTNMIFGNYALAEKYIRQLEHTLYYSRWATGQRKFLWNDEAVASDKEYGPKRTGISHNNNTLTDFRQSLADIVEADPTNRIAMQYLAMACFISSDIELYNSLRERYENSEQ